jgi:SAM-dependent methyltransferase
MFTTNWFESVAKKNFEKHLKIYSGLDNRRFLEIGCFEGAATSWTLKNILTGNNSAITVVDTFEGSIEHKGKVELSNLKNRFFENIQDYKDKVNVIVGKSQDVLRNYRGQFDFIYVDGSHLAFDVLQDAILVFDLLKYNGILAFDDYQWDGKGDQLQHPQIAIDAFLTVFADKFEIIEKNYQLFLKRVDSIKFVVKS